LRKETKELESVVVKPTGPLDARARVPGSKSLSARALIAAALAEGRSELEGLLRCDDTRYLGHALTELGIVVSFGETGRICTVDGLGGDFPCREARLYLGNAGTAMRFLTGILATAGGDFELDGDERMRRRPIRELVEALSALGARVESTEGFPPVRIGPRELRGGTVSISGARSSQFVSALLLAGPASRDGVEVTVVDRVVSRPYLDLTVHVMDAFGCPVEVKEEPLTFRVAPGRYEPREWPIEPDASSAGYFFAAAAVTGGRVLVEGLKRSSLQGDIAVLDVLERMGCRVTETGEGTAVEGGDLRGVEIDASGFPDLVPTIAAVALFARGTTEIRGVPHLRIKESDRIASVRTEFGKLGAEIGELDDGLVVRGGKKLTGARIDPWNDHRIAMSAAVIGLAVPGVVIENPGAVDKSFPGFFDELAALKARGR